MKAVDTLNRQKALDRRRLELASLGSMKATEVAEFLGISDVRVYQLRKAGVLSFAMVGGKIVFPRKAVVEYLALRSQLGTVA